MGHWIGELVVSKWRRPSKTTPASENREGEFVGSRCRWSRLPAIAAPAARSLRPAYSTEYGNVVKRSDNTFLWTPGRQPA